MEDFESFLSFAYCCLIIIIIFCFTCIPLCACSIIIDTVYRYELEDVTIECVITHMDIDDGKHLISVVSIDNEFSKTILVSNEEYAKYIVGDTCIVLQEGYCYPSGNVFTYKIVE